MDSIFSYTDYRRYLLDYFQARKASNPRYSLRMLADRAGFKARDYLLRVMNGKRNLSPTGANQLCKLFRFSEKQSEYFHTLVLFNQAGTTLEKEELLVRLSTMQKYGKHQRLRSDQSEYLSAWYHSAIRSLLPVTDFGEDYDKIARLMDPPLTAKQVRDSVDLLLRLGLLQRGAKGRYAVTQMALSTGDEVASVGVARFHKATMDLAKRSIDKHSSAARDISGLTMSVSQSGFNRIKSEIRSFRKKIMAIATNDSKEEMIYQLNLHLFPLTRNQGRA